jgi:hypothetical protein
LTQMLLKHRVASVSKAYHSQVTLKYFEFGIAGTNTCL